MTALDPRLRHPWTDAFGGRVDPDAILAGFDTLGLPHSRLRLRDPATGWGAADVVLEYADADPQGDPVAKALTWLVERLSPLSRTAAWRLETWDARAEGRIVDERTREPSRLGIVELTGAGAEAGPELARSLRALLDRAGVLVEPSGALPARAVPAPAPPDDGCMADALVTVGAALGAVLAERGLEPGHSSLAWLRWTAKGPDVLVGGPGGPGGVRVLAWRRPGSAEGTAGVAPAMLVAAADGPAADHTMAALVALLGDAALRPDGADFEGLVGPGLAARVGDVWIDGLVWGTARRPTVAREPETVGAPPVLVDAARCLSCGECALACPTGFLGDRGEPVAEAQWSGKADAPQTAGPECLRCWDCVDLCPADALRPATGDDTATLASALRHRPGWFARARGAAGPLHPAPFPPSFLRPAPARPHAGRPRWVLGLAVMTMAEHAAVLLRDGELVGAVEEEKLARLRHYGWRGPGRADFETPAVDPTLQLEEVLCRRSIRTLLADHGLTLDDMDVIAVNGLHGRYRHAFSHLHADAPIPTLTSGRVVSVPHHLAHAASTYRVAGVDSAWIFTVDGRGDRETAGLYRAEGRAIRPLHTLLSLNDRSIGGVYGTVTELLGFGLYGQGSVMALAGFGDPADPSVEGAMDGHLEVHGVDAHAIHEGRIGEAFGALRRRPDEPLTQAHQNLAAALQDALERAGVALVGSTLERAGEDRDAGVDALCLAGGVTLNCHMNNRLRLTYAPKRMFVQPGANDGGTALGAAAEAHAETTPTDADAALAPMRHAMLGPRFDEAAIARVLRRSDLGFERVDDVAEAAAERLAMGQVVCWFQGGLEFGPRALGGRSILADPRDPALKDRVNQLKTREAWRPFGPSVLSGREGDWFEGAFDTRFMLFTLPVHEAKRAAVPAIVHVDGTSRPQVVHADTHPEYHALISAFERRTGVPMVVNTSFNRRGEPIVCSPEDALDAFVGLRADVLAIGPFLVEHPDRACPVRQPSRPDDDACAAMPSRVDAAPLVVRLAPSCELGCRVCPVGEGHGVHAGGEGAGLLRLIEGREDGQHRVVFVTSERAGSEVLATLVRRAKAMGYTHVTHRTHGAGLRAPGLALALARAGVDRFELTLLAGTTARHDALTGAPGALAPLLSSLQVVARAPAELVVQVPMLRGNLTGLRRVVKVVARAAGRRATLAFRVPRPIEGERLVDTAPLAPLSAVGPAIQSAAAAALDAGLDVRLEAVPACAVPAIPDGPLAQILAAPEEVSPAVPAPCRECAWSRAAGGPCGATWDRYLELVGTAELAPRPRS